MIVKCHHCQKQLKLSDKIRESIAALEPGRKVKLKCIQCGVPFSLDAKDLGLIGTSGPQATRSASVTVRPPAPPSLAWLREGVFEDQDVVEDIPRALILMANSEMREAVHKSVESLGYLVELADNAAEAIERMRFVNYAAVFLHSHYEPGGIKNGKFHAYMRAMNMSRRRYIFYVLIGEQFETLYDLQALAFSANLVVNDMEIQYIGTILKKAIPEYEALFGPLMEELQVAGK